MAGTSHGIHIRRGKSADLDALWDLESRVFATDRMSRRSLRRLLASPSAAAVVARSDGAIAGVAVLLFRTNSRIARLYSLAVAPKHTGRGIASALLAAAEKTARSRKCQWLRLEVHEKNHGAIQVYRKAGYNEFGRHHHYYQDRGDALKFEKRLTRLSRSAMLVRDSLNPDGQSGILYDVASCRSGRSTKATNAWKGARS
ncbi:MAG TPA: N-acetyltransferase [Xanthobacteraceae bacterium]|nr:N-acetyltransferase [Xanthobacteraceae bacterium]